MADISFSNAGSGSPSLFVSTGGNCWCAFILLQGQTTSKTTLSFTDASQLNGFFLFSALTPTISGSTLVSNMQAYPAQALPSNILPYFTNAIGWLSNPNVAPSSATANMIWLSGGLGKYNILANFNYNFGNNFLAVALSSGININADLTNSLFSVSVPQNQPYGSAQLVCNELRANANIINSFTIPLVGQGMGKMLFITGFDTLSGMDAFDVGMKYFYPDSTSGIIQEMNFPLFINGVSNYLYLTACSVYPFDLLNKAGLNTYFAYTGQTLSLSNYAISNSILPAAFVTDYGYPLSLIPITNFTKDASGQVYPVAGSAMMLLCSPASENPSYPWYLTVGGSFTINIDSSLAKYTDTNGQMRLLCGLSGLETISFTPQTSAATGDQLVLQPNQAAFTPQFPVSSTGNVVGSNTTQKWLTTDYLTTWVTVLKGAPGNADIVYHAQAQGAALFSAGLDGIPKDSNFLGYYPANSGTISKASANFFFPLVAYSSNTLFPQGVSLEQFEQQILNPSRRTIVAQNLSLQAENAVKQRALAKKATATANLTAGVAACPDGCICTTSPQGFYIAVDTTTFVWDMLQLASNQYPVAGGGLSPVYTLSFETLGATLQSAFQSNQLFLVISYNETLADGKTFVLGDFNNEMYIEGWPFILNVPTSDTFGQYNNVLIFKFCGGTLIDRVQNIQLWNTPNSFNDSSNAGLPNISMWLQQYIQDGINRFKGGDLNYSKFNSIATDPTWQGMVALGVQVDLDNFPAELQGLLAGIDLSRFNAHHFGIDLSIIQNNGGTLTMQPASSLFGLIDYEDQTYESLGSSVTNYQTQAPINTSVDYVYSVLTLKVLFVNSKIVNFSSYIAITLNKLFGETVKSTNRQNLVILDGTYENHDGVPSYTFNTTGDQLLYLDSQIINEVEILKASFNTIVSQNSTTPDAAVDARFSFWGYINFFSLKGFDLLSFGSEIGLAPNSSGLAFSNLFVDLSFPLDKPTSQTFTFDIGQISFDIGNSTPRRASLYPHFPLQLTGMTSGDATSTPTLQGFLDVDLPGLQQQQDISGNWYGLVFTLNMGTPGALASAAGFNATFVIGWNVGATGAAAGLQLPGVNPQAPFLSLQGILRVDIGSIQLLVASDGVSYLMKINNIDLKVFTLSFPPGGSTSFFLFGNPASSTSQPQSMGWYAAYLES